MAKREQDDQRDAIGRRRKKPADPLTSDEIREFAAIFREPERYLIELAKQMDDTEIESIKAITQGIETKLDEIMTLIHTQFQQKIEKEAFRAGQKYRRNMQ